MTRDMTPKQFDAALQRHGMTRRGELFGYVKIMEEPTVCVCRYNGGNTHRAQLAYLISEQTKAVAKYAKATP